MKGLKYYQSKLEKLDEKVCKLKSLGVYTNQGIAFVTFSSIDWVYETFNDFDLILDIAKNTEASKMLKINNWEISNAPPPSDIIWENLSNLTRIKRKLLRVLYFGFILFLSVIVITLWALLDKFSSILELILENTNHSTLLIIMEQYMTPTILLLFNYILVPTIVKKFIKNGLYMRKSQREKSQLTQCYLFLVSNSIIIPLSCICILYQATLIMLQNPDYFSNHSKNYLKYSLVPTGCFFLRYLIQIIFSYAILHIFGIPMYIDKYIKKQERMKNYNLDSSSKIIKFDSASNFEQVSQEDILEESNERSNKWYFEIGYQQSFSISIFALIFIFACIMPIALPLGCVFFGLKYYIDKYNMIYRYRIEYEANAYIRRLVCIYSVFSICLFQLVMVIAFLATGDDDMIVLSLLLLISSVLAVSYFISTETWKGKTKEKRNIDTLFEDDYDKSDWSDDFTKTDEPKLKNKQRSSYNPLYAKDKFNVDGMTPPSASTFKSPFYSNMSDAYLHPCAKKFSTEEVQLNKETSYRTIARFSASRLQGFDDESPYAVSGENDSSEQPKYSSISDYLTKSLSQDMIIQP